MAIPNVAKADFSPRPLKVSNVACITKARWGVCGERYPLRGIPGSSSQEYENL